MEGSGAGADARVGGGDSGGSAQGRGHPETARRGCEHADPCLARRTALTFAAEVCTLPHRKASHFDSVGVPTRALQLAFRRDYLCMPKAADPPEDDPTRTQQIVDQVSMRPRI